MNQTLISDAQSSEGIVEPSERPFDHPSLCDRSAAHQVRPASLEVATRKSPYRDVGSDLPSAQFGPERSAVIPLIGNETARTMSPPHSKAIQRGEGSDEVMTRSRHQGQRQRNSLSINDQRALRPVETELACRSNRGAPFFAGTGLASRMVRSSRSLSWRLSMIKSASQRRSHVPSVIH